MIKQSIILLLFALMALVSIAQRKQYINRLSGNPLVQAIDTLNTMTFEGDGIVLNHVSGSQTLYSRAIIDSIEFFEFSNSHSCGASFVHNPSRPYGTLEDHEGNIYRTIKINNRWWMAENLNTGTFRNGDVIPEISSNISWALDSLGAYCYYDNNPQNACPYGKLYNFYACDDPRGICPIGWHIPSYDEWSTLGTYLTPSDNDEGLSMKSSGTIESGNGFWHLSNQSFEGVNTFGFSGLPGGLRESQTFSNLGYTGGWWSSTALDYPYYCYLSYNTIYFFLASDEPLKGYAVRCIRN